MFLVVLEHVVYKYFGDVNVYTNFHVYDLVVRPCMYCMRKFSNYSSYPMCVRVAYGHETRTFHLWYQSSFSYGPKGKSLASFPVHSVQLCEPVCLFMFV